MENDTLNKMTTFDSLLQSQNLQLLKAAIPYLSGPPQKALSVLTKYVEFIKTVQMSTDTSSALSMCSVQSKDKTSNTILMMQELKNYCSDAEKENIDFFLDCIQIFDIYANLKE